MDSVCEAFGVALYVVLVTLIVFVGFSWFVILPTVGLLYMLGYLT